MEEQAIDRVHRLGQTAEAVTVLRLVVTDTVEQQMLEIQVGGSWWGCSCVVLLCGMRMYGLRRLHVFVIS